MTYDPDTDYDKPARDFGPLPEDLSVSGKPLKPFQDLRAALAKSAQEDS